MDEKIEGSLFTREVAVIELSFLVNPGNYEQVNHFDQDLKERLSGKNSIKADVVSETENEDYHIRIYLIPLKKPIIEVNKLLDIAKTEAEKHGIELSISKP